MSPPTTEALRVVAASPVAAVHDATRVDRARGSGRVRGAVLVGLTDQAVERVAARVVDLLATVHNGPSGLVSAGELARFLRVERPWVYRHRDLLGGQRIGTGPRAPWRFDPQTALRALQEYREERGTGGDV